MLNYDLPAIQSALKADRKAWPTISAATGLSLNTLRKLAYNDRKNPTVKLMQPLADYFNRETEPA